MKQPVYRQDAPPPVGPYAPAIRVGPWLFTSGQIALDPQTGRLVEGDIRAQTRQVLENLRALLEAAGGSLADVVKTTCYLTDLGEFAAFNEVYATFFPTNPPARSTVQAARLPLGALVEIDAVAYLPGGHTA